MVFSAGIKCVDDSRPQAVMFPRVLEVIFSGQIMGTNLPRSPQMMVIVRESHGISQNARKVQVIVICPDCLVWFFGYLNLWGDLAGSWVKIPKNWRVPETVWIIWASHSIHVKCYFQWRLKPVPWSVFFERMRQTPKIQALMSYMVISHSLYNFYVFFIFFRGAVKMSNFDWTYGRIFIS